MAALRRRTACKGGALAAWLLIVARALHARRWLLVWAAALLRTAGAASLPLIHATAPSAHTGVHAAQCANHTPIEPLLCGAVAFRHLPKTGGSALRLGFLGMAACGNASWTYVQGFRGIAMTKSIARGFLSPREAHNRQWRSLAWPVQVSARLKELRLDRIAPSNCTAGDGGTGLIPRMVVESHDEFSTWTIYLRALPAARAAWPRCRFVTVSIVREPLAHSVSQWAYFPGAHRKFPRFADYIASLSGEGRLRRSQAMYLFPELMGVSLSAVRARVEGELSTGTLLLGVFEQFAPSVLALAHELGVPWAWPVLKRRPVNAGGETAAHKQRAYAELHANSTLRAAADTLLEVDRWLHTRARAALDTMLERRVRVGVRGARRPAAARCQSGWADRTVRQIAAELSGVLHGVKRRRRRVQEQQHKHPAVEYVRAHHVDMCEGQDPPACAAVAPSVEQLPSGVRWP